MIKWEISPPFMTLDEKVGEGAFGFVYSGSVHKSVYNKLPYTKLHPNKSLISGKKNKVAAKLVKGKTFVFPIIVIFTESRYIFNNFVEVNVKVVYEENLSANYIIIMIYNSGLKKSF